MTNRRSERRVARRQEIMDAAMAITLEGGIGQLTMARLAKRLDAAVGALYRYFPGKSELMLALHEQALEALHGAFEVRVRDARAAMADMGPAEQALSMLATVMVGYTQHAQSEPEVHQLIVAMTSGPQRHIEGECSDEADAARGRVIKNVSKIFDAAAAAGALSPGDGVSRALIAWAFLHGLDHFRKLDNNVARAHRTECLMVEGLASLLTGWGASRASAAASIAWASANPGPTTETP